MSEQKASAPRQGLSKEADKVIRGHAFGSGVAGYIPFPVLDGFLIMAVQRKMIFQLARLYSVPFSRSLTKDLLKTLAGGMALRAAIPVAIKAIPGIGMLLGSAGMATIGGAWTYAVGKVFQQHFEKGGTLEDFDPEKQKIAFENELKTGIELAKDKNRSA